jgi:GNAT superfamily N-acetyltransferase
VDPTFRIATEADADLLLAMMREYYAFDGHAYDGRAWLICDGDMAVGYIVLTFGYSLEYLGRDAFIDEFYLRESYRGRGWGRRTLEFVEEAGRAADVRTIHLEVVRANTRAKEVYRRAGYSDHDHYLMSKWIEKTFPKPHLKEH